MAKVKLRDTGFTVIPEGEYTFKIVKVDYKVDFEKIEVHLETESGLKHVERFVLSTDGGAKAFSYFAKVALNDWSAEDIDSDDLLGCYFTARVEHDVQPNINDPSKKVTFVRLQDKKSVDEDFEGWETVAKAEAKAPATTKGETFTPSKEDDLDLDDLLS